MDHLNPIMKANSANYNRRSSIMRRGSVSPNLMRRLSSPNPGGESSIKKKVTMTQIIRENNMPIVGAANFVDRSNKRSEASNRKYRAYLNFLKSEKRNL